MSREQKGRQRKTGLGMAKKAVVAVKASKEIPKTALVWAFTHVVQPGDALRRKWGFPRFSGDCASSSRKSQTGSSSEQNSGINDSFSQMILQLHDVYDPNKINVKIKIVSGLPCGAVAAEAKQAQASWVVLDKQLKHEEKRCMVELQCNIVTMKRSQAKVLRLNLVGSSEKEAEACQLNPEADEIFIPKTKMDHPILGPLSLQPAVQLGMIFTATEAGTSSVSSSDLVTSPFCSSERNADLKKEESLVIKENQDLDESISDTESENLSSVSLREAGIGISSFRSDIEFSGNVREAVALSRNSPPGPPPLCSICQHKAPVFGKPPRFFTSGELELATGGFSQANFLAEGGFGSVYGGVLPDGQAIAVKQHKLASSQGDHEFCSEVEVLSCAQHRNVVMLIGFCIEDRSRLLVYEFICNGSLDSHLYGHRREVLEWSARKKIAVGAARGMRYLHEECRVGCILHRDMRPKNTLITHDFEPLVGDFGLARWQPDGDAGVETRVIGTFGYLAPEYAETGQITEKADVYSFGVVLVELVTGQKAVDLNRPKGQQCLTEWARPLMEEYAIDELVDPGLEDRYSEHEVYCMLHAASLWIRRDPHSRPRMSQVLRILEGYVLIDANYASPGYDVGNQSGRICADQQQYYSGSLVAMPSGRPTTWLPTRVHENDMIVCMGHAQPNHRSPSTLSDLQGRHALPATFCSGELIPPAPRVIPLTSAQETSCMQLFMICHNPVKYAAVPLEEDDDIGTMVGLHESTNITVIELFVDVHNICDVPGSSRGVAQNPSEMTLYSQFEEPTYRFSNSFMALLESVNEVGGTSATEDEDEEIEEPVLGGDENIFGGGTIDEVPTPYEATPHIGKNEATLAIKEYCIKCHVDIHVAESNQKTLYAKCIKYGLECKWKIRVSKNQRHDVWVITRYNGPHTCLRNFIEQDHRLLDSDVICEYVKAMVEKDPRISCSVLAASIQSQFGYQVKYGKVWNAKMKAMKLTYGDWDTSYNELPHLLQVMKRFIPGTIVKSQTMPVYDEEGQLLPGKKIFHRLFWAFKACIEGFPFCKRMIQVDGRDNRGLGFLSDQSTSSFLISDRGTGILAAIERPGSRWIPPYTYLTFCIRHIGKNSIDQFHNAHIRSEIVRMGYKLRRPNFDKRLENLKVFYDDQRVWKWASKIPREKWSQAYDEGRRYGHMTTNLAEAINSVLKGTRHLPIASVMKETYFRLAKVWSDKGKKIESLINRGKTWAPTVVESIEANERLAWKYPCAHVVDVCMYAGISAYTYVDECFHLRRILNVYSYAFRQIPNESYWPRKDHDEWLPNPMLRRSPKGRPESTRIHTSMDFHARERGQAKRCGLCRGEGHSKNNCPNLPRYRPHH
ncbi:Proline-rich receptor-like protein kinase PERK13 [Hibiscus syriacus]|uniref:Proline-rich receptor-like protein kinase PERK13 n=1 Tax=Hibiscus syriacus TaxID=106335 RepID=A0A6A2Z979_HIBSY|nr:Proline-rich receptor-like protein kinase PERK13 [Hibiscus syriacus]